MKKLIIGVSFVLLLAGHLGAAVTVSCAQVGPICAASPQFTVSYTYDGVGSFPRTFALDITTNRGTISGVTAAKTGESTSASKGFGIFPGTIVIDSAAGTVSNIGSPIAPDADLPAGTLDGVGTTGVTIELGSLYGDSTGKPNTSGVLVTVGLSVGSGTTTTVTIVPNMARNGVVLEDGTSIGTFSASCTLGSSACGDCFCNSLSTYARWTLSSRPNCWCPPPQGTGYQCIGDAAQDKAPITNYRCYTSDLSVISNSWKKIVGGLGYNACADVDHAGTPITNYGVYSGDLSRLTECWKKNDGQLNIILGVGTTGGYCGSCTVPARYR